jgi:hypothetical protein
MSESDRAPNTHLEHLFDMELEYHQGKEKVYPEGGKLGDYLGSGEGAVFGPVINGVVHWDLFEEQDEFICGSNLRGIIKTDDGFQITFESVGYFMRPDMSDPTNWVTSASVHFQAEAGPYAWLNNILAIWQGVFDMGSFRHSYRVYSQVTDKADS